MMYKFNGKNIRINDEDLNRIMTSLEVDKEDAVQIWLEDEGYLDNAEQTAMTEKAKENKINLNAGTGRKNSKPKEKKPDVEKINIVKAFADFLIESEFENVTITNESKLIEFDFGENHYKLDLIRTRKQKN